MHKVAADLTRLLGLERVLWEAEHLATYGFDGTATLYAEAGCVALPKTTAEVIQVVRYAAQNRIPVVTRGSGTGLSGGSVPVHGCIVLCLGTDGPGARTRPKEPHHSRRERRGDPKSD